MYCIHTMTKAAKMCVCKQVEEMKKCAILDVHYMLRISDHDTKATRRNKAKHNEKKIVHFVSFPFHVGQCEGVNVRCMKLKYKQLWLIICVCVFVCVTQLKCCELVLSAEMQNWTKNNGSQMAHLLSHKFSFDFLEVY